MKNKLFKTAVILGLWAVVLPTFAQMQGVPNPGIYVGSFLASLGNWVSALLPVVMAIAVLVFFWGIVSYMTAGADEEKRGAARNLMIYGVIGLFVMVSIWGLVKFLGTTFGITQGGDVADIQLQKTITQ